MNKPIILIGFKHTGKSALGRALAERLNLSFIDLDHYLDHKYHSIKNIHHLQSFRALESKGLSEVMQFNPGVLALGGGAPLAHENRQLIKQGLVVHVRAPKGCVYERIMIRGRPSFFPKNHDPYEAFMQIWETREPIYQYLANITVDNLGTIDEGVDKILSLMNEEICA